MAQNDELGVHLGYSGASASNENINGRTATNGKVECVHFCGLAYAN
jgi:hypothetical protein